VTEKGTKKRRNRLSPAGRQRCREGGRRGALSDKTERHAAAMETFEAELLAELAQPVVGSRRALVTSAVACYGLILQARNSLALASQWRPATEVIAEGLKRQQAELRRCLMALGVVHDVGDEQPDAPPKGGIADWLEQKAREKAANAAPIEGDDGRTP
jgi:hypothetical protein